jgi:ubiquinone/menaquinone biosynthesis C-methylase UbiE
MKEHKHMSTPQKPQQEHPNTYAVQDHYEEELKRLQLQDEVTTLTLGGLLPEQEHPEDLRRVLDVACGNGGWLIRMAKKYPDIAQLIGGDVNNLMLNSGRARASEEQVDDRVEFHQMDALRMLEFPTDYFDLVNQRFGMSYLRTWDWPKLLQEFQRVTRPGGVIRLTESDYPFASSSPTVLHLFRLLTQATYQAGHLFALDKNGVSDELARLLHQYGGIEEVQTRTYMIDHRAGTAEGTLFAEDVKHIFRVALPFLQKWTRVPDDYEEIYQRMLSEMQHPDCVTTVQVVTAWGIKEQQDE